MVMRIYMEDIFYFIKLFKRSR